MQLIQAGKGFVIIITIVFSSLSFTLGYFVGKFGAYSRPEVPAVVTEPAAPSQNSQTQQPAEPLKAQPELSGTPVPPAEAQSGTAEPPVSPSPPQEIPGTKPDAKSSIGSGNESSTESGHQPGREPAKVERDAMAKQVKEVSKTAVQGNKQASAQQKQDSPEPLYAVQLGAFRNKAEADKIRAKYSKKGYKIYIEAVRTDRKIKIYKLRTGEFREKKDAEVLAIKLKKAENLKTFVVAIRE